MVIFYGFDRFFLPNGTPLDPRWTLEVPVIWRHKRKAQILAEMDDRGVVEIRILGHGNFLRFWPIFWPQWDPIGIKMDPRGSPQWFGALTVRSNFGLNQWARGSRKFEFWGMVIVYGFHPIFGSNGTPLAPRGTLGGPHRELAP